MIPAWCFIALRNFMGAVNRPEPALWITLAAIPANALLAYALIHGAFGLPRLDLLGAGIATTVRQYRHVRRRYLGLLRAAARSRSIACSAASGARTGRCSASCLSSALPISGAFMLEWGAVLLGRAADGLDRHHRARRASDRAAGRVDPVHGAVRHLARRDRARRTCGRPPRSGCQHARAGFAAIAFGAVFMLAMTADGRRDSRDVIPLLFLGGDATRDAPTRRRLRPRCCSSARASSSPTACRRSPPARCAGSTTRACRMLFAAISFWVIGFTSAYGTGFSCRPRRDRHLDRILARRRHLCRAAGLAIPSLTRRGYLPALTESDATAIRQRAPPAAAPEQAPAPSAIDLDASPIAGYRSCHGGAPDDRPARPSRRRHRGYARGPALRALHAAGRDRRGRAWPGHPDRRHLIKVDIASPDRIAPICPHFGSLRRLRDPALGDRALPGLETRPGHRGAGRRRSSTHRSTI